MALGGFDSALLKLLNGFLVEVSATYFFISTISLDIVFKTFCKPSISYGSLVAFFFESSLKVTFLNFLSSRVVFFSKEIICFSTAITSFIFSAKVGLAALSTKMAIFKGKAEIYHSIRTSSLGLDVAGTLFKSLLNCELKSLMGYFDSVLRLERSLINVVVDLSSSNLVKNCSWKAFQLLMDLGGNEKYHDPAAPYKVYAKSFTTASSSVTPFKFIDNIKLFMCSSASMSISRLNFGNHFSRWAGN